jgi:hypothetical protein
MVKLPKLKMLLVKWYQRNQHGRTIIKLRDVVIRDGIKQTCAQIPSIDNLCRKSDVEEGIKETHDDVIPHTGRVEGVIKNGVKDMYTLTYSTIQPNGFFCSIS